MPKVINLDDRLIEAMQDGDESALSKVIQRYTAYVGTIVWNIVGGRLNEDDTKEIVSDVFYTLWKNSAKVRKGKLKAYLSSISRSRALDALRRSKQEISIEEDDIEIPVSGPEDEVVHAELYAALREALNALPEPDRTIFIRHYYYYQKTNVIAEQLGMNAKTVQTKLCRGRETLRRVLTEGGYFIEQENI